MEQFSLFGWTSLDDKVRRAIERLKAFEPPEGYYLAFSGGDRKIAYSNYIKLYFSQTGRLAPGCDNKDLQAFYDSKEVEHDG